MQKTGAHGAKTVIFASSLGTVFEWYDFYLYGTLAVFFGAKFFPTGNDTATLLANLAVFGAGFGVRPFGAVVFGHLGDLWGRKATFLLTIIIMGLATMLVGLLPGYDKVGLLSPILLVTLRLAQGLALGGEYGGAATYIAEHAPAGKRGAYTAWIQTTATAGLFLSLLVILACRSAMTDAAFKDWGWRLPFLFSAALLAVSVWIRLKLNESPLFQKMKDEGKGSKNPVGEAFGKWSNAKVVLLALVGLTMGQGVVWYTGQFQALFFLQNSLRMDYVSAYVAIMIALALGAPVFVVFGALSDKIGRKPIIMAGMVLAVVTYFPLFHALTSAVNPALTAARAAAPAQVAAVGCETQFLKKAFYKPKTPCDKLMEALYKSGVNYDRVPAQPGQDLVLTLGSVAQMTLDAKFKTYTVYNTGDGAQIFPAPNADKAAIAKAPDDALKAALTQAGYPTAADKAAVNWPVTILILWVMVIYVTMVYGPIAAYLVELFPTRIRYTSRSLPYHIGNGWFGGFLPFFMLAIAVFRGDIFAGLWYPIVVAGVSAVVGILLLKETKDRALDED
ncbi:MAG: transporter [Caulobacteraceae bacterium]|nr:transporter [Caulobacteraceae bacterium]